MEFVILCAAQDEKMVNSARNHVGRGKRGWFGSAG